MPMSTTYTHQVTAQKSAAFAETMLLDNKERMSILVAQGKWTQEEADHSMVWYQNELDQALAGTRVIYSRHKTGSAAVKSLQKASVNQRFINAEIEINA